MLYLHDIYGHWFKLKFLTTFYIKRLLAVKKATQQVRCANLRDSFCLLNKQKIEC